MPSFLQRCRLILAPPTYSDTRPEMSSFGLQRQALRHAWFDDGGSIGLERVVRLFLAAAVFVFPAIYLRHLCGKHSLLWRKAVSDAWVLFKCLLPLILLILRAKCILASFAIGYLLLETAIYVLGNLMLADIYGRPFSERRTFVLLLVNYWEITGSFAYLYFQTGVVVPSSDTVPGFASGIDAIYFSTVVSTTLGFGDLVPKGSLGRSMLTVHVWTVAVLIMTAVSGVVGAVRSSAKHQSTNST